VVRELAGLSTLTIETDAAAEQPADAAAAVVAANRLFLLEVIDREAEKQRLIKHQKELAERIDQSSRKLANENFVSRAKPEVVQRERDRLAGLEREAAAVREQIEKL
jgi:valyl-tRNA synthetase